MLAFKMHSHLNIHSHFGNLVTIQVIDHLDKADSQRQVGESHYAGKASDEQHQTREPPGPVDIEQEVEEDK